MNGSFTNNIVLKCLRCKCEQEFRDAADLLNSHCPRCDGLLVVEYTRPVFKINPKERGVWRYSSLLPNPQKKISLGEGLTKTSWVGGVLVKNERSNPTGTYADRASALITSFLSELGETPVGVEYAPEFTRSIVTYINRTLGSRVTVISDDLLSVDPEDAMLFASLDIVLSSRPPRGVIISYVNPLLVEGLKTIVFEMLEQEVKADYIVVPTKSGALALSIWKGLQDLKKAGVEFSMEVVAATPSGCKPPLLSYCNDIKIVQVPLEELYESYKELARRGFTIKPIAALGYHVAKNLGRAIAVVTMGYKPRSTRKTSNVKKLVLDLLSKRPMLTAYEIWKENPVYTLRAVYKAVKSLEESHLICFEVVSRGRRKVKLYKLC